MTRATDSRPQIHYVNVTQESRQQRSGSPNAHSSAQVVRKSSNARFLAKKRTTKGNTTAKPSRYQTQSERSNEPPKLQVLLVYLAHEHGRNLGSEPLSSPPHSNCTCPLLPVHDCVGINVTSRQNRRTTTRSRQGIGYVIAGSSSSIRGGRERGWRGWWGRGRPRRRPNRRRRQRRSRSRRRSRRRSIILAPRRRLGVLLRHDPVVNQHEGVSGPLSLPRRGRLLVGTSICAFLATETLRFHVLWGRLTCSGVGVKRTLGKGMGIFAFLWLLLTLLKLERGSFTWQARVTKLSMRP